MGFYFILEIRNAFHTTLLLVLLYHSLPAHVRATFEKERGGGPLSLDQKNYTALRGVLGGYERPRHQTETFS